MERVSLLKNHIHHGLPAVLIILIITLGVPFKTQGAPKAKLWPYWQTTDDSSTKSIDHAAWTEFLEKYLVTDDPSGVNLVRYGSVTKSDRQALVRYIDSLTAVRVTSLNRNQQKAYWINLYNAQTVKVILDHYPVESIRDIDLTKGVLSDGPWDAKLLVIEGMEVSLNDIEHRILRPVFKDNRIHYAVNCASIGCPNLQPVAYTAGNTEELLDRGAREYINSRRGVDFEGNRMYLSGIYVWFKEDFGGTEKGVKEHLLHYASPELADRIRSFRGRIKYRYNWNLNE